MFSYKKKYPFGLDISDLSLKLVQFKKRGGRIKINTLGREDLPEGLIKNGKIIEKEKVVKKIKDLVNNPIYGKISSKRVVASLPEAGTFVKFIKVRKNHNNLDDVVETEIEKNIPYKLENIYFDWQVVNDKDGYLYVLAGVCPMEISENYFQILSEAGLSPEALELEPIAICRSVLEEEGGKSKKNKSKNYLIIDVGSSRTDVIIYSKNTILFSTEIPISGEKMTEEIAARLKKSRKKAEKIKLDKNSKDYKENKKKVDNIFKKNFVNLDNKIKEVIEFYNYSFPKRGSINKILLCGGGANVKDFGKLNTEAIISQANPLINTNEDEKSFNKKYFGRKKRGANGADLEFSTAIGLALSKVFIKDL